MKDKISATVEASLVKFLDSLPGKTRSEKLERILSRFRQMHREQEIRKQLRAHREGADEEAEREAWEATVAEAMWTE